MKVRADLGTEYRELKQLVREQDLHTVCEEAGCPNIYECWSERTATFMILGDRCTRACGFCLVDTRKPFPIDPDEPGRVADAVATLGLAHAVITSVARDDLPDGGAAGFAATIDAIRDRNPDTTVEVLIPDCKGDAAALDAIFAARPDVLNHNLETVARLQRLARPSAGYARSLGVLARAKDAGLVTKSGIILGLGETPPRCGPRSPTSRAVGVDILTLGQYLRPSAAHLPVARWGTPAEFAELGDVRARRSGSRTSSRARSCARATTPATAPTRRDGTRHERGDGTSDGRSDGRAARAPGAGARGDGRGRRRRAAAVGGRRPPVLHRLRGDAARAAHDARARPRRRGDARRPRARGAAGARPRRVHACGRGRRRRTRRGGRRARRPGRVLAIGDQTWSRFTLALQAAIPDASWRPAQSRRRAAPRGEGRGRGRRRCAPRPTRSTRSRPRCATDRSAVATEIDVSRELVDRMLAHGHDRPNFAIVGSGPNGASPHHDAGDAGDRRRRRRGVRLRRHDGRLLLRHHADVRGRASPRPRSPTPTPRSAAAQELAVRAATVGTTCEDVDAVARPRARRATASPTRSSTASGTASASTRTRTRTSSPATPRRSRPGTRSASSPASTSPVGSGCASRTSWSPTAAGPDRLNTRRARPRRRRLSEPPCTSTRRRSCSSGRPAGSRSSG